jgi:hypothetical protein
MSTVFQFLDEKGKAERIDETLNLGIGDEITLERSSRDPETKVYRITDIKNELSYRAFDGKYRFCRYLTLIEK